MHQFTVMHACGHEAPHASDGDAREAQRLAAAMAQLVCPACIRSIRAESAATKRTDWALPALVGTPDDMVWAETIRIKVIETNQNYRTQLLAENPYADNARIRNALRHAADTALHELMAEPRAAWWVENHLSALTFVKMRIVTAIAPLLQSSGE